MADEPLKPCPFCGFPSPYIDAVAHGDGGRACFVYCPGCGTHGPWFKTGASAAFGWNRRYLPPANDAGPGTLA